MNDADRLAEIVKDAPHSFHGIRRRSDMKLNDAQFSVLIKQNPERFAGVRFSENDANGVRILPGLPGVKLISP